MANNIKVTVDMGDEVRVFEGEGVYLGAFTDEGVTAFAHGDYSPILVASYIRALQTQYEKNVPGLARKLIETLLDSKADE